VTKDIESYTIVAVARAMDGDTLLLDAGDRGLLKVRPKTRDERWGMYCNHYRVTFEKITPEEAEAEFKKQQDG